MELTIVDFDRELGPTYRTLVTTYDMLLELGADPLDDALASLGVERKELERLRERYWTYAQRHDDMKADRADLSVLAFLLRAGAENREVSRLKFEAAMAMALNNEAPGYFVPFWVPCVPAHGKRDLFIPVIAPRRSGVLLAYEGLVRHVRQVPIDDSASELALTAIIWRVAALVDGLVPGERSLYDKMNEVRYKVVQGDFLSEREKRLWQPLTRQFAERRHALSHMVSRDGETFETACKYACTSREELVAVSTALGFAVLQEIADDFAFMPPPTAQWNAAWSTTDWIDDYL